MRHTEIFFFGFSPQCTTVSKFPSLEIIVPPAQDNPATDQVRSTASFEIEIWKYSLCIMSILTEKKHKSGLLILWLMDIVF